MSSTIPTGSAAPGPAASAAESSTAAEPRPVVPARGGSVSGAAAGRVPATGAEGGRLPAVPGVRTLLRLATPTAAGRRRISRATVVPLGLTLAGVVCWLVSLGSVDLSRLSDYGLLPALPATWFLGVGLILAGATAAICQPRTRAGLITLSIVALILALYGTVPAVSDTPQYFWVYKHIGVTRYIELHGSVNPEIDIYHRWPGFFAVTAAFSWLAGRENPVEYAAWAEVFFPLVCTLAVVALGRRLLRDTRLGWVAGLLFALTNWVGQSYYAPQAYAFTIMLGIYILLFDHFGRPQVNQLQLLTLRLVSRLLRRPLLLGPLRPAPAQAGIRPPRAGSPEAGSPAAGPSDAGAGTGRAGRAGGPAERTGTAGTPTGRVGEETLRLTGFIPGRETTLRLRLPGRRNPQGTPPGSEDETKPIPVVPAAGGLPDARPRVPRWAVVTLVLVLQFAVVATHQLTPYLFLIGVAGLALLGILRPWWLAALLGLVTIAYLVPNFDYVQGSFGLFTGVDPLSNVRTQGLFVPDPLPGKKFNALAGQLLTLSILLLAAVGAVRWLRRGDARALVPVVLVLAAASMIVGQSYGGEGILRVVLFSLPWTAILAVRAFAPPDGVWRPKRALAVAPVLTLLAALFVPAFHGQAAMNIIPRDVVEAAEYLYTHGERGLPIVVATPDFPVKLAGTYDQFGPREQNVPSLIDYPEFRNQPLDRDKVDEVMTLMGWYGQEGYLVFSSSQEVYARIYQLTPPGALQSLERALLNSGHFTLWHATPNARIYYFQAPDPAAEQP